MARSLETQAKMVIQGTSKVDSFVNAYGTAIKFCEYILWDQYTANKITTEN